MHRIPIKFPAIRLSVLLWCCILTGICCTPPPQPVIQTCPQPLWKEYSSLQAYEVRAEIDKFEKMLATGDTTAQAADVPADSIRHTGTGKLSALEINQRLFELSIHHANPDYNVDKIADYVVFLYQHGGPDSLRYLNWGRAAREQRLLLQVRDSLETVITSLAEGERKKDTKSIDNLKKDIKTCQKQRDSLIVVITSQQEMITKLQKLDLLMEKQRNKIR